MLKFCIERAMRKLPVETKTEILVRLQGIEPELRALSVRRIGLFGSFVKGRQSADSDVDLLLEFEPGEKSFDHFMSISFLLEETVQRPVELVTIESLSPYLGPHILKETEDLLAAA
jgi:predicted nucleotidyltransferase